MNLDRLRERVEEVLEATARERYALVRGSGHRSAVGAGYADAASLFNLSRISEVQRAVSESTGLEERRARFLLAYLARGRACCSAASELDRRLDYELMGTVQLETGRISPAEVPLALAELADPEARRRLEAAWLDSVSDEAPTLDALHSRERETYEQLGYGPLLQTCEIVDGEDLRALAREGERALADSDAQYRELLEWYLPRLAGVEVRDATAGDRHRLASAVSLRHTFHSSDPYRDSAALVARAGLDAWGAGQVHPERVPHSRLPARAASIALKVPGQVVIAHAAVPGRPGHAASLGALGRTLQATYTDASLPVELRWLGDEGVPLAWARLFSGLLAERSFLRDRYGVSGEASGEHARVGALLLLLEVRRRVGLLLASMAWSEAPRGNGAEEAYVELMGAATGLRHDPREAAWDTVLPMEAAAELRGDLLGAVLALYLRDRFDEDWYRNPAAGEAIRRTLSEGRRFTASELAVQLTSAELSFGPLLQRAAELTG